MKLSEVLFSYVLFAGTALAHPRARTTLEERVSNRASGRQTRPADIISEATEVTETGNQTNVAYSTNWSGAVLTSPPAGTTFNGVSATFVVPTPKVPSGQSKSGTYSASAWVGIDGDTYQNAILQTGVDFTISNGAVSYDAWYEWYPAQAFDFSGISISAGDSITVSVTSTSSKAGKAVITNNSKGKTVSKSLTSSAALGGQNAEWIVEDFESNGSLVNFANFGTVTFTNAVATTGSGSVGASGADILDIKQSNTVLTSAAESGSSVTVSYTG
ncbi:Uncharacterized protein BP5553_01377 [Venustampulla echinocandica]|uniref:Aspergillopepsin-2 n=1 Tax=Venustampulla echinocandica TaxID=2656787 RepID=A0A370U0V5_9HELO|nr:Uncharacterized protein BP5553_01377 [Venustampulla echinocandica]RDL41398.1 Uncharacterized protein BP5553_01377 [Venustampulla echinocandica]